MGIRSLASRSAVRKLRPLAYPVGFLVAIVVIRMITDTSSGLFLVALMALYALAALGLNVILGMGGMLSVAQAAVMAVGGYTSALLLIKADLPFVLTLLAAAVSCALLSAFASLAALRVSSHYFILVTLGIAEAVSLVLVNQEELTGGYNGLTGIPPLMVAGLDLSTPWAIAVVSVVVMVIGWYIADAFRGSRIGYGTVFAASSPQVAMACGIDIAKLRIAAAAIGGVYAGVAGALFAEALQFLGPADFGLDKALILLLIVVIGGMGSNMGTVCAAILLTYLSQGLLDLATVGPMVYGLGIMTILVIAPNGLAGMARSGSRAAKAMLSKEWRQ